MPFNQTKWADERNLFRAVTGGAYRLRGAYGVIVYGNTFPAIGTIPLSTPSPGTIISQGANVRGTGTSFLSQLREGYYIHAKNVVRKILSITSDTLLVLESGFPTDIAAPGEGLRFMRAQTYTSVYVKSTGAADATLQEAPFIQNDTMFDGGAPISYNAGSGQLSFTVTE